MQVIALVGSAGALAAVSEVLSGLPADLDAAVIVLIHTRCTGDGIDTVLALAVVAFALVTFVVVDADCAGSGINAIFALAIATIGECL